MNWGRRYFEVDARARAAAVFEEEPARHFVSPLLSARALELAGPLNNALPHAMEISYLAKKPVVEEEEEEEEEEERVARLILRADSEDERLRWIDGLQARIRRQAACAAHPPPPPLTIQPPPSPAGHSSRSSEERVQVPPSPAMAAIASATQAARTAAARLRARRSPPMSALRWARALSDPSAHHRH